jgi:hypothetical protein
MYKRNKTCADVNTRLQCAAASNCVFVKTADGQQLTLDFAKSSYTKRGQQTILANLHCRIGSAVHSALRPLTQSELRPLSRYGNPTPAALAVALLLLYMVECCAVKLSLLAQRQQRPTKRASPRRPTVTAFSPNLTFAVSNTCCQLMMHAH